MSSSSKKKLRKEQATANLTEKQIAAKKEEKQLKVYTAVFWVVLGLCFCLVAGMALRSPVTGLVTKASTGAVVGEHKLSGVELNYFYIDAINKYCNQYGDYLQYFLDTSKPIGEQFYEEESKTTWADEFLRMATDSIKNNYALYDAAKAAGHTLSEDEKAAAEDLFKQLKEVSKSYGYPTANGYLKAMYGKGASVSSYRDYYEVTTLASSYYTAYTEQLKNGIDDAALREFEADKLYQYNSYSYATLYLNVDTYKQGGTKGEDDKITYSAEEIAAAEAAMKAQAEALAVPENNTVEALNAAMAALANADKAEGEKDAASATATENKDVLYSKVNSTVQEWIRDEARQEGDISAIPYYTTSTDADGKEVKTLKGYYVTLFQGSNDNTYALKDVRHILVSYEGGTKDENGSVTYSDEEKNAAKEKAEAILKEWTEGAKTEESFAALAKEKSTDPGSKENGGLYEGVYPGQMVAPFEKWCFDADRKAGDTGVVQTDYGYHVMYMSGDNEVKYRDYMIKNDLLDSQINDWQTALNEATTVETQNTKHINRDLILNGGSSSEENHEGHDH